MHHFFGLPLGLFLGLFLGFALAAGALVLAFGGFASFGTSFGRRGHSALRPRLHFLVGLLAVGQDLGDADQGEFLAEATLTPRVLAPAFLERDDFRPARVIEHLGRDRGAG